MPRPGDDIVIPCEWQVVFNVAEFEFGTLYIDGILKIDASLPSVKIKANNIWVRGGKIVVGEEGTPYTNNLEFEMIGGDSSPALVIDDLAKSGNKAFVVTG